MLSPSHARWRREAQREALTGVSIGQPLSRERTLNPGADAFYSAEGNMIRRVIASVRSTRRGQRPWHVDTRCAREPGGLRLGRFAVGNGPYREGEQP